MGEAEPGLVQKPTNCARMKREHFFGGNSYATNLGYTKSEPCDIKWAH